LVVAPDLHGMGIGRRLLLAVEEHAPASVRLFVLFTGGRSASNIRLYRKVGYVATREERISDTLTLVYLEKPAT
jgi:tRNA (guanine37-N1)-methyltransferase